MQTLPMDPLELVRSLMGYLAPPTEDLVGCINLLERTKHFSDPEDKLPIELDLIKTALNDYLADPNHPLDTLTAAVNSAPGLFPIYYTSSSPGPIAMWSCLRPVQTGFSSRAVEGELRVTGHGENRTLAMLDGLRLCFERLGMTSASKAKEPDRFPEESLILPL